MLQQKEILDQIQSLPTLPSAMARLAELVRDEKSNASDFESVIRPDPALTTNLLRLANSAFFGLQREVTSVRQAITLMGTKRVFEVAATVSFSRVLPDTIPGYGMQASKFWLHSVAVAALAEKLAHEMKINAPDMIFTAGLLHDMGKLGIGSFLMEHSDEILSQVRENGMDLIVAEREVLGTDHAELGAALGEQWSLPDVTVWTARWHHEPNGTPDDADQVMVDLVHLADGLAHTLGLGVDKGEMSRTIEEKAIERLGVNVKRLERVACETIGEIWDLSRLFSDTSGGSNGL